MLAAVLASAGAGCGGDEATSPTGVGQRPATETTTAAAMDFLVARPEVVDERVFDDVYGLMLDQLDTYGDNEHQILSRATRGQRMVWVLASVEGEIYNGGFHQLFWNSPGEFTDEAIVYADELGASVEASLLRQAVSIFPSGVPEDPDERQDALDSLPAELSEAKLGDLDDEWYDRANAFSMYMVAYIEAHPNEFFVAEPSN